MLHQHFYDSSSVIFVQALFFCSSQTETTEHKTLADINGRWPKWGNHSSVTRTNVLRVSDNTNCLPQFTHCPLRSRIRHPSQWGIVVWTKPTGERSKGLRCVEPIFDVMAGTSGAIVTKTKQKCCSTNYRCGRQHDMLLPRSRVVRATHGLFAERL